MGTIAYARPSDNIASTATVTASAQDSGYPAANLVDLDVSNPAKLTTQVGGWDLDFGAPVTLAAVALMNHNFDAGLGVMLQAFTSDPSGSPAPASPDFEQAFTIPPDEEDGFSVYPWLDLSASPRTYRYWRIWVAGSPANSENLALGEVVALTSLRALPDDWQEAVGLQESEDMPDIVHESGFGGQTKYPIGVKWKIWDGGMNVTEPDDHWSLARDARGRTRPWFFVPDRTINAAYLVTFDWSGPKFLVREVVDGLVSVPAFRLREQSRGVPL